MEEYCPGATKEPYFLVDEIVKRGYDISEGVNKNLKPTDSWALNPNWPGEKPCRHGKWYPHFYEAGDPPSPSRKRRKK